MRCPQHLSLCLLALQLAESADLAGSDNDDDVAIYFGSGCFWHIQHSFIQAEKQWLHRSGARLTAIAGYAGANAGGTFCYQDGKVHTEAVELVIPRSSVGDFAGSYFRMFKGMDRSHTNDRGPNYRAAIGLPGGVSSPLMQVIEGAMQNHTTVKFELKEGKGDDPDTLRQALIWIYDSNRFPFQQAELYHQFHDDYLPGGDYPPSYHNIRDVLLCTGRLKKRDCNDELVPPERCNEAISECKRWTDFTDENPEYCEGTIVYLPDSQDQIAHKMPDQSAERDNAGRNAVGRSAGGSGAYPGAAPASTNAEDGTSSAQSLIFCYVWQFLAVSVLRLM